MVSPVKRATLRDASEAVDVGHVAETAHDLAAVRVVPDGGIALDRIEAAAAEVLLDDPDVVGQAAVPVVDRDVARQWLRATLPHSGRLEPRFGRRHVRAALRVDACALEAGTDHVLGGGLEAVADEDVAPRNAVDAEPLAEPVLVRARRVLLRADLLDRDGER